MSDRRFSFLENIWKEGRANYLIKNGMKLRFAIAATIINSVEIHNKRILDIGCGITHVPEYLNTFACYHGMDVAPFVINKNREYFKGKHNISFSVDDMEGFQGYENYNTILCLGWAFFSRQTSRPDIRLREFFVSMISQQHELILLEASNDPDYIVGVEDLERVKEALTKKNFFSIYKLTFNIKPKARHGNRCFIVLKRGEK